MTPSIAHLVLSVRDRKDDTRRRKESALCSREKLSQALQERWRPLAGLSLLLGLPDSLKKLQLQLLGDRFPSPGCSTNVLAASPIQGSHTAAATTLHHQAEKTQARGRACGWLWFPADLRQHRLFRKQALSVCPEYGQRRERGSR